MVGLKRRALQATSAPHTPATYPSHIPQLHLHLHLHLQLPIVATPLSYSVPPTACFDPTWACYSIASHRRRPPRSTT